MDWKLRVVDIMSIFMFLRSMTISWKYQRQSFDLLTCDYDRRKCLENFYRNYHYTPVAIEIDPNTEKQLLQLLLIT
jgi:hypothetical protein